MTMKFNQRTQTSEDNEKKLFRTQDSQQRNKPSGQPDEKQGSKKNCAKNAKKSSNRLSFCLLNHIFVNNIGIIYKFTSFKSQANASTLTRKLMDFAYDFKFCFLISKRI